MTGKMTDKLVVLVTCANLREAKRMARTLVDERLAACVNIHPGPVLSVYRWQGKLEQSREILLLAKTSARLFPRLEGRVRDLHSYQTPEIVALPLAAGSPGYLDWLERSLAPKARKGRAKQAVRGAQGFNRK